MKARLLLNAGLAMAAFATTASAADLRVRAPIDPPFSWSGCYIGGYVGGAWQGNDGAVFTDQGQNGLGAAGSIATPPFQSYAGGASAARLVAPHAWSADNSGSFLGGGTIGCNWQSYGSRVVYGIEGEAGHLRLRGQAFDPATIAGTQTTLDVLGSGRIGDWYGMVTGRLGYAWTERTMLYVKGGAAFVPTRASVVDTCQNTAVGCGNWLISTGGKENVTTWTVGGGVEWAYTNRWTVKAEYMFIGLDNDRGFQSCASAISPAGTAVNGGPFCFNNSFGGIHTAKVGLNYKLGGGY